MPFKTTDSYLRVGLDGDKYGLNKVQLCKFFSFEGHNWCILWFFHHCFYFFYHFRQIRVTIYVKYKMLVFACLILIITYRWLMSHIIWNTLKTVSSLCKCLFTDAFSQLVVVFLRFSLFHAIYCIWVMICFTIAFVFSVLLGSSI